MAVKKVLRRLLVTIVLLSLSALASCGGGSGTSSQEDAPPQSLVLTPVTYVSPDNGAPVACCSVEFALRNGSPSKYTGGVYQIILYDDKAGLTTLARSDALSEDVNGEVRWTPSITLQENRAYWWKWSARYTEGNVTSAQGVFHVMTQKSLMPMAPRDTGWMDANFADKPTFAIFNSYTGAGVSVSYDIEVYADESLSALVTQVSALPQESGRHTTWRPHIISSMRTLDRGATYYWRSRATLNGFVTGWGGPYSFTVQNPCAITGSPYASYGLDWSSRRSCPALLLTDPAAVIGPPDAASYPWRNFISIDDGGDVTVEMGATVTDRPGPDIRVYQYVSTEPMEVMVGPTEVGPWYSLGAIWCGDWCDFDLAYAGVSYARYIKIRDLTSPMQDCHETAGSDIDAVQWLQPTSATGSCGSFGGGITISNINEGTAPIVHSAPEWIKGVWNLIEIGMGTDYTGYNLTFTVTDTGFEYSYPGCHVKGRLSMDPKAKVTSANAYTMVMDNVTCVKQWDISAMVGNIDTGFFWGVPEGTEFYRSSFNSGIDFWIYTR